jgi:hypothetical protein
MLYCPNYIEPAPSMPTSAIPPFELREVETKALVTKEKGKFHLTRRKTEINDSFLSRLGHK